MASGVVHTRATADQSRIDMEIASAANKSDAAADSRQAPRLRRGNSAGSGA
jgi:hypothetical protein